MTGNPLFGFAPNHMMGFKTVEIPEAVEVIRLWKERLFSFPWQPMKKTKWVPNPACPERGIIWRSGHTIYASKRTLRDIINMDSMS